MNNQANLHFTLSGYKPDYKLDEDSMAKKNYNLTVGGVHCYYDVYIADVKSTEFLITCCYEKLAGLATKIPNPGWSGVPLFKELQVCLKGEAKNEFKVLEARDYSTNALKNAAGAFTEIKQQLITKLSDHPFPGDQIYVYLSTRVKYMRCKKEGGQIEEPVRVLVHIQCIRTLVAMLEHNKGAK